MKTINSFIILILLSFLTFGSKCKKESSSCACNNTSNEYVVTNSQGYLSFFPKKSVWILTLKPSPTTSLNYIPCNSTQDSLRLITQNASVNIVFTVVFSGKIKKACPGEDFGIVTGTTTFDYIVIDSVKRN